MHKDYKIIKEEHHWTSDEKIKWLGYGEWVEEPDSILIEYLGYEAAVQRIIKKEPCVEDTYFGGHLCGYVKIPEEHPLYRDASVHLDCHGGLTFNGSHEEHWVGFDCGHSMDYIPSIQLFKKVRQAAGELEIFPIPEGFEDSPLFNPVYRNVQYCIHQCLEMIQELHQLNSYKKIMDEQQSI